MVHKRLLDNGQRQRQETLIPHWYTCGVMVNMHRKLSDFLGDKAYEMKIFEAFARFPEEALTPPDLEAMTDVPHTTLYRILEQMETANGIHKAGKRGRANQYRLNTSLPVIQVFADAVLGAQTKALETETPKAPRPRHRVENLTSPDLIEETTLFTPANA